MCAKNAESQNRGLQPEDMPSKEWLRLAKWAKENDVLNPQGRSMAFNVGRLLGQGKRLTDKQRSYAASLYGQAVDAGFEPTLELEPTVPAQAAKPKSRSLVESRSEQLVAPTIWDTDQREVIEADAGARQLILASPGCGKTAVLCARVASLMNRGVAASRILVISFTRTAVAEIRDRIGLHTSSPENARGVQISTLDSHAWALRSGFEEDSGSLDIALGGYEFSIDRAVFLLCSANPELSEFLSRLEHVFIDEAQDIVGNRAKLVSLLIERLSADCGVTVFADPLQGIYGFTNDELDDENGNLTLLHALGEGAPETFKTKALRKLYRVRSETLRDLFEKVRRCLSDDIETEGLVESVGNAIRVNCDEDAGAVLSDQLERYLSRDRIDSILLLFRRRIDAIMASSYLSSDRIEHRLRLSGLPVVVHPWIGCLFRHVTEAILTEAEFARRFEGEASRLPDVFGTLVRDDCWVLLRRLAAGRRKKTLDLRELNRIVSRSKPPVELCWKDYGERGPVVGTIHASKGREAETVVLVLPEDLKPSEFYSDAQIREEGRVLYVGATRAKERLIVCRSKTPVAGYLSSGRVFHFTRNGVQLEIGRTGDVDPVGALTWENADVIQSRLATLAGEGPVLGSASWKSDFGGGYRIFTSSDRDAPIGQLSAKFAADREELWRRLNKSRSRKVGLGSFVPYVYILGAGTFAIPENARSGIQSPYCQSGFALVPIIKGFSAIKITRAKEGSNR